MTNPLRPAAKVPVRAPLLHAVAQDRESEVQGHEGCTVLDDRQAALLQVRV